MSAKKVCVVGDKTATPDCYAIVRVTEKGPEIYNNVTESWYSLDSGKGSLYNVKDIALKTIDGLCAKFRKNCFFLVAARKQQGLNK